MQKTDKCLIPSDGWVWLAVVTQPIRDKIQMIKKFPATIAGDSEEYCYIVIYVDGHVGNDILTSYDMPASLFGNMAYYVPYQFSDFAPEYEVPEEIAPDYHLAYNPPDEIMKSCARRFGENERE